MTTLSVADTTRLLAIVENDTATFAAAESQTQELVASSQRSSPELGSGATAVITTLRAMIEHTFVAKLSVTSPTSLLVASFLLHNLASAKGTPTAGFAKAGFGAYLEELEAAIREDARAEEELRYKTSTAAGKKPLTGRDALAMDGFRLHLLLKAAAFRMILGTFDLQRKPRDILSVERAAVDAEVDGWSQHKVSLTDAVSDLRSCVENEARLSTLGGIASVSIPLTAPREPYVAPGQQSAHHTVYLPPVSQRLAPPNMPVIDGRHGEFRTLFAPSMASLTVFDGAPHQAEWRAVCELLATARKRELTSAQVQTLITHLSSKTLTRHLGLTIPAWLELTATNPQVAVACLPRLGNAAVYLDALLSTADGCRRSPVLLGSAKLLTPQHINAYCATMVAQIRSLPSPAETSAAVSAFAVTLHQLCEKQLPPNATELVTALFAEHASAKDVASLWGHLNKS